MTNTITKKSSLSFTGIARLLVAGGLINPCLMEESILAAQRQNQPLVFYLIKNTFITANKLATAVSQGFHLPLVDLDTYNLDQIPIELVHEELIRTHQVLPLLKRDNQLFLAVADPSDNIIFEKIKFHYHLTIHPVLVEADKLYAAIENIFKEKTHHDLLRIETMHRDFLDETFLPDVPLSIENTHEDAPIIRHVHNILFTAITQGASDIHFETHEKSYQIRFRIDGILRHHTNAPNNLANRINSRLKVMAQLDIAERRLPQDGRCKFAISPQISIDLRVSTCPSIYGEKIVVRILDATKTCMAIDALGIDQEQKKLFLHALQKPQGMLLVTGPTGSGKTVSLYTALNILNTSEINILTVEDPVEIQLPGITQVNVNSKIGLTFASILRAFLRQDPDVIMVGEMRDKETAEIGIKAAQTGHLVLSTLHTNNAAETITRLINMEIPGYHLATSITLIMAQRLVRKLCDACKIILGKLPREELVKIGFKINDLPQTELFRPNLKGCDQCTAGYKSRVGIFEFLPISETISEMIMSGAHALDIIKLARQEGLPSLRESGLRKVALGITSLEEINRVTQD